MTRVEKNFSHNPKWFTIKDQLSIVYIIQKGEAVKFSFYIKSKQKYWKEQSNYQKYDRRNVFSGLFSLNNKNFPYFELFISLMESSTQI